MDVSTFKGFLRNGRATPADFTRSLHSALTGISRHTIDGRDDELSTFRENMLTLANRIHDQANTTELESTVSQALDLFRDYNNRNLKFHQTHTRELRTVMRTMTETITYLSESRTRSVHQLQFMERELEQASQVDDIRLLRARVISCLDVVREETVRLQSESQTRTQEVRELLGKATIVAESSSRFGVMDTVTGLPSRRAAERTISETLQGKTNAAVAIFVVTKLSAINAKYGRTIGDEVMLRVANHYAQHLSSDTLLYRWSGPALVALINIYENAEEVKHAWAKAAAAKLEINLEAGERSVYVVVETTMLFQLMTGDISSQDLFHKLDQYVAKQGDGSPEDY